MKTVFTVSIFILTAQLFGQTWRSANQSYLNIKYKIPTSWTIDGFGSDIGYWDNGGSSVCDCAGTINFNDGNKVGMVIYPTDLSTDPKRREYVWDYHFIPSGNKKLLNAKKIKFEQEVSNWELIQGTDEHMGMLDDVVWKLTAKTINYGLIIYIWGDGQTLKENETTVLKILDTMVMLKQ